MKKQSKCQGAHGFSGRAQWFASRIPTSYMPSQVQKPRHSKVSHTQTHTSVRKTAMGRRNEMGSSAANTGVTKLP